MSNVNFKGVVKDLQDNDNPFMKDLRANTAVSPFFRRASEIEDYDNYIEYEKVLPYKWV